MQAALATVKIAVLLFYMRIFESPRFIMAAWVGIGIVSAWGIVAVVVSYPPSQLKLRELTYVLQSAMPSREIRYHRLGVAVVRSAWIR
jgi:hypothetical protein